MRDIRCLLTASPASGVKVPAGSKPTHFSRVMLLLLAFCFVLAGCAGKTTPAPTPTPEPTPVIETRLTAAERAIIFDTVWQTVNDKYFDPTFGGRDWQAIGEAYRQQLAEVQDDQTFWFQVVN
ncbi:MAG: hypothetical protein PVF70_13520, partial [Anaerolineales bacterium]